HKLSRWGGMWQAVLQPDLERHPDKEQQRHKPADAIASPPHQCQRQRDRARDLKLAKERDQGGNDVERIRGERLSQVEDLAVCGLRCTLGDEHGQYYKSQGEHTRPAQRLARPFSLELAACPPQSVGEVLDGKGHRLCFPPPRLRPHYFSMAMRQPPSTSSMPTMT